MSKVAVIGKIVMIETIKDADRIKLATVVCGDAGRWTGVVGLDHHIYVKAQMAGSHGSLQGMRVRVRDRQGCAVRIRWI